MTEVAFNPPMQYAYHGMPAPPLPQPVPVEETGSEPLAVASYDVGPAAEHAPPAQVVSPTAVVTPPPSAPTSGAPAGRVAVQVVDRLRSTAERGTTTVPTAVIEKIAVLAVREVPGVHDFAPDSELPAGDGDRPLAVHLDGRTATVEIRVVVEYGFAVYAVTDKVRTKVISALENLFALDVTAVDIVIDDIHIEEPEPADE